MPFTVNSFAVTRANGAIVPHKLERRDVAGDDVLIAIVYAGVCHSDIHMADGDWGVPAFPLVTGHEIVGVVSKVGPDAKRTNVGEIVAVGCMVDSCGACQHCELSHEMFCTDFCSFTYCSPERRWEGHVTAGGYSEAIVVAEHFVLKVPEPLHETSLLRGVAPILCAGITTYSPLRRHNVGKGSKVAIIGLGGLGHMGVKLAKALGAEVTVVSRSHKKDAEAKILGADKAIASTSKNEMKGVKSYFDLVIDTIPFEHDLSPYISIIRPYGNLCIVGHIGVFQTTPFSSESLIFGNRSVSGSSIGGIQETQELLDLCADHAIIADYELISSIGGLNDAWAKMRSGDGASRYVIDIGAVHQSNKL